jgi:UDP-N-acetylmuramoylalanine--D-glutamate ligase
VELIGAIHRAAGAPVAVAGNVGQPVSALVGRLDRAATVACEASSFQLEDADSFAPEAAVFLNISEDHLDRHASFSDYLAAKLRIFAHQRMTDLAVLNGDDQALSHPLNPLELDARTVTFGMRGSNDVRLEDGWIVWNDERVIEGHDVRLRGTLNLYNAMAAAAVCLERGLDREAVAAGLREFTGLPHRLEHVTDIEGVEYINDSKATNPGATNAAVETLGGGLHVILGGSLKGETEFDDLDVLGARAVYLIGEATDHIAAALEGSEMKVIRCGDLPHAVAEASQRARPGEKVLLSPACASFDQYRDYEERGEHFKELVRMLAVQNG